MAEIINLPEYRKFLESNNYEQLLAHIKGEEKATPIDPEMSQELIDRINNGLNSLTTQEKTVIELKYGLSTGLPLTIKETAILLNKNRERIRSIKDKALNKLRALHRRGEI